MPTATFTVADGLDGLQSGQRCARHITLRPWQRPGWPVLVSWPFVRNRHTHSTLVTATPSTSYARRAIAAARVASGCVLLAAALVFIGWLLDVPALKSLYLPGPTLKTNAALCLACGALASLLTASMRARRGYRWAAWLLSAVQIVIAALTLSEHVVGWNLGIDQL